MKLLERERSGDGPEAVYSFRHSRCCGEGSEMTSIQLSMYPAAYRSFCRALDAAQGLLDLTGRIPRPLAEIRNAVSRSRTRRTPPSRWPGDDLRDDAEPGMVIHAGDDICLAAVGHHHAADDVELPLIHRLRPLPRQIIVAATATMNRIDQIVAHQDPVDRRPVRQWSGSAPAQVVAQSTQTPPRMIRRSCRPTSPPRRRSGAGTSPDDATDPGGGHGDETCCKHGE
jgi:hypothetical protein